MNTGLFPFIHTIIRGYRLNPNAANGFIKKRLHLSEIVVRQRLVERGGGGAASIVFVERTFGYRELGLHPINALGQCIGGSVCRLCATRKT